VPLILGGDCTITLGVISGSCGQRPGVALAYVDGDDDMSTPATTTSGILDAMGIATMLAIDGAARELVEIGNRVPLMQGDRLAIVGYDDSELGSGPRELPEQRGVHLLPGDVVRGNATEAASETLAALADRDGLIVHFDVDVIDSTDLPLGQYPHFNRGLSLSDATGLLSGIASAPDVVAVVITEVNPDNDPDDVHVRRLVAGIADALGRSMANA
jgi:arginase